MARRHHKTVSPHVAKAEAWFGVTHSVPSRGTKAHARMMREYARNHPRKNPWDPKREIWVTREGARRHPQNCPIPLAASMLTERRTQGRKGQKKTARFANCDYRSAEIAMHFKPPGSGSKFSGQIRRGRHADADWVTSTPTKAGGVVNLSFYKHAGKALEGAAPRVSRSVGRLLEWWP